MNSHKLSIMMFENRNEVRSSSNVQNDAEDAAALKSDVDASLQDGSEEGERHQDDTLKKMSDKPGR